ncbi:hypothetical protein FQN55_000958 [Onygenales sp. PD_40]|nr:hypothetical protein FQN55_000958 [Onygenales sp. PD_40]
MDLNATALNAIPALQPPTDTTKLASRADIINLFYFANEDEMLSWVQGKLVCLYFFKFYKQHLGKEHWKGLKMQAKGPMFKTIKSQLIK